MKNLSLIIMMALSMILTSCDEHEPIDLDIHPGYILCSYGQIVSPSVFNSDVHTPVAVVFTEKTDKHQALAVLLDEIAPVAFADTLSFDQKTSGSETEYDGYVNRRWACWPSVITGFSRVTMCRVSRSWDCSIVHLRL